MPKGIYKRTVIAPAERFWAKVDVRGSQDCWEWMGARSPLGYGRFAVRSDEVWVASRYAWHITNGPIPAGMSACHRCDNPPCCNPAHLFVGTRAENNADMRSKGRDHAPPPARLGEASPRAILTDVDVRTIRRLRDAGWSYGRIGVLFGIRASHVYKITARQTWKHVA